MRRQACPYPSTRHPTVKKNLRVQFDLPEEKMKELDLLMEETGIKTRRELFNNALTILEWAVDRSSKGFDVAAYRENTKELHVLAMPALSAAFRRHSPVEEKDIYSKKRLNDPVTE